MALCVSYGLDSRASCHLFGLCYSGTADVFALPSCVFSLASFFVLVFSGIAL